MKNRLFRRSRILFIVLVILFVLLIRYMIDQKSNISEIITTITAAIGVFAIWFEMNRSKNLAEAEFIMNLNHSFVENEGMNDIYLKLDKHKNSGKGDVFDENDIPSIVKYLTFFETIYGLIKRGLLNIDLIDDLFAYRFFLIVNNKEVQRKEIIKDASYYKNLYKLHSIWNKYRAKKKFEIINRECSLDEMVENYIVLVNGK